MHFVYFFSYCCLGVLTLLLLESVNGEGGNGVYDYSSIQSPCDNNQNFTLGSNGYERYGIIVADYDGCYNPNSTCRIKLSASSGYHISVTFQYVSIATSDVLIIKDEAQTHLLNGYITPIYSIYSNSNWMNLEFITNADINKCLIGFRLYYTSYHYGECSGNEFRCSLDGRCIPSEVKYDSFNNCGDWSDEGSGTCDVPSTSPDTITSTGVILEAEYHLLSTLLSTLIFIAGSSWSII